MNISLDYIKAIRQLSWDSYFEAYEIREDLIRRIENAKDEITFLSLSKKLKNMNKKIDKLAEASRHYDQIYCFFYDPIYPIR